MMDLHSYFYGQSYLVKKKNEKLFF